MEEYEKMNFMELMQLKEEWEHFRSRHPKFPLFLKAVHREAIMEGTVIEIQVTAPDGKTMNSNLKVRKEDLELLKRLEKMF